MAKQLNTQSSTKAESKLAESKLAGDGNWTVHCDCPTPLDRNPCTVAAVDEDDAVKKFFAVNGISGSDHKITATLDNPTT